MQIQPDLPSDSPPKLLTSLKRRLFPHSDKVIQWAAYAILFAVMIFYILAEPDTQNRPRFYGTILCLSAILLLNIFWDYLLNIFHTEEQGQLALLVTSGFLALVATWTGVTYNAIYLILMITAQANIILRKFRPGLIFTIVLTAAFLLVLYLSGLGTQGLVSAGLSLLTGLVFVVTLSRVLVLYTEQTVRLEKALTELQAANTALIEARQKEQELAVAEERVRMARDIHDGLGHHLTALSIQLQAASKLLASQPEKAAASIAVSREEAQAALREVRQSVAALRQAPLDLAGISSEISRLVSGFERAAGLPASLQVQGEQGDISAAAAQTLYRAVQEGLTNAQKHATGATHVLVDLCWQPGEARLVIQDDGQPGAAGRGEAGFGLAGIYERVEQLHGSVASGPLEGGGFRIQISIPTGEDQ